MTNDLRFLCDEMLAGRGRWLCIAGYDWAIAERGRWIETLAVKIVEVHARPTIAWPALHFL